MFFSIIIPTFNRENLISRSITSILNQTFSDFEIIIVDDGSIDNTKSVVESFKNDRVRYFKTENFGVAHARNFGSKNAIGQYIGFLDSDDVLKVNHLQCAYDFVLEKNKPAVIHLNFEWGLADQSKFKANVLPLNLPFSIFNSCSLHVNCVFLRKDISNKFLFNESRDLMFAEDWDFFIKLSVGNTIQLKNICSAYLIDHEERSMRNFNEEIWVKRRNALIASLKGDELVSENYYSKIHNVSAHMNSLIALNLAIRKDKIKSLRYLFLSLKENRNELFKKRTAAIFKYILIYW
jgi:glycosyltransferase involved in cell wall biosynthesis